MMELTINGSVYNFNFGFGFMKELDKRVVQPVKDMPGQSEKVGFRYELVKLIGDEDVNALVTILEAANKGQEPRLTRQAIESYIEDSDTDIDELFETVIDFLSRMNATRKVTKQIIKIYKEADQKEQEQ